MSVARVRRFTLDTMAMMPHPARLRLTIVTAALVCVPALARAQDTSAWDVETHAAARLIAGAAQKSAGTRWLRAGVEIRLDRGWKTFWRYPGDSGVPPTLDFAGSENVKSVTVLWPAPERIDDGSGGHSIGYERDVVLPLRVLANDATQPASLHVKVGYAVCGNLCIPAEADLKLMLSGEAGTEEPALVAAEARVPRRVSLGAGGALAVRSVRRQPGGAHERVVVEVAAPQGSPVELFVEGPTPDWALPLPEPEPNGPVAAAAAPTRLFAFDLDGLPPDAHAKGAALTFTAVSGGDAIEVATHLD
jgi:DsbC/DsbD-like thiol-disulfide interchange protein